MTKLSKIATIFMIIALFAAVLTACSQRAAFEIRFISDGEVINIVHSKGYEVIAIPEGPEKQGMVFDGWFFEDSGKELPFDGEYFLNFPVRGNVSIYAKFKAVAQKLPSSDPAFMADEESEIPPLPVPTGLTIIEGTRTLVWNPVPNAPDYTVEIDGVEFITNVNSYSLISLTMAGDYAIRVRANGFGTTSASSDFTGIITYTRVPPSPRRLCA